MISQSLLRLSAMASMVVCLTGCSSAKQNLWKPQVRESFVAAPQLYQRVAIAPIALVVRGHLNESLRLQELGRMRVRVATNIVVGLKDAIEHRGYQMVNLPPVLAVLDDWEQLDADTRDLAEGVQEELLNMTEALAEQLDDNHKATNKSSSTRKHSPTATKAPDEPIASTQRFGPRLADLIDRLGLKDAPSIVLLHETAFIRRWGEGYIHRVALVDTRTLDVLWMRVKPLPCRPYNEFESTSSFHVLLKDLPRQPAPKEKQP